LPVSAPGAAPAEAALTRTETVLVVDDEESFRKVVVRQLQNAGFAAIEARDGTEAIQVFAERQREIIAVLLDLVMPNTSGGETLAMLRYYAPALPVVVTSGYSELDALSLKEAERGVGFLRKPFTAAELTTELRRVINERLPQHRHSTPPKPLF
jgi:two-component system cell cycle sensor histidine kinase/response regulator CckA